MRSGRLTNGQRAAVCGLVIAGISLTAACKIVGVNWRRIKASLPDRWHARVKPASRWKPYLLADAYESWISTERTATIAARYGVSASRLEHLARQHGWPNRKSGPKATIGVKRMSGSQRHLYNKLRQVMPPLLAAAQARAHRPTNRAQQVRV